ncbi:MAG: hypothetical protein DHS20C18_18370 [Saprospiraceae bacterium]|nr:MAG: hypothetical protein DHS20C18_18370 [Saprospiraceae bacterium]
MSIEKKRLQYILVGVVLAILFIKRVDAQSVIVLEECDFAYIDPQDANPNSGQNQDTLVWSAYFDNPNFVHQYYIDINAFGGQQVDRTEVYAILPNDSLKLLSSIAFGNCLDCVTGFALINNGNLEVESVNDVTTMNMWIQSFGQPDFALSGNLQTLSGVGRLSGQTPGCAIGLQVEYIVYSNPASTSTEFSTYLFCPEPITDCTIVKDFTLDCGRDSIFLEAVIPTSCFSADASIRWYNNQGWQVDQPTGGLPIPGNLGWYYLLVEDECCRVLDSLWIDIPPFAEAGPDQIVCKGDLVTLAGQGGVSRFWEQADGMVTADSMLQFPEAQAGLSGQYVLHAINEEGCEDTDTLLLDVNVPPMPEVLISNPCLGETLTLEVLNDSAYTQINWMDPQTAPIPGNQVPDFQLEDIGTYFLEVTDLEGCDLQVEVEVTGNELPEFETFLEEGCDSNRVHLFPPEYHYTWETGDTGAIFSSAVGGVFALSITDEIGCTSVASVEVPAPDGPAIEFEVTHPRCPGDFGVLTINVLNPNRPTIFSIDGGQNYFPFTRFDQMVPDTYTLVVQDDLGCIQDYTFEVIAPDTLGVTIDVEEINVRPTTPISLEAQVVGNAEVIQWVPREIDTGEPTTDFIAMRDMDIRIIVRDERGCFVSAGFPLTIVLGDIYVPNAISPNDDGINDQFTFFSDGESGEIIEYLAVFDRYGGLVFEEEELPLNEVSRGWDGRFMGRMLNPGVYTYFGRVRFGNGATKLLKGDVTLLR